MGEAHTALKNPISQKRVNTFFKYNYFYFKIPSRQILRFLVFFTKQNLRIAWIYRRVEIRRLMRKTLYKNKTDALAKRMSMFFSYCYLSLLKGTISHCMYSYYITWCQHHQSVGFIITKLNCIKLKTYYLTQCCQLSYTETSSHVSSQCLNTMIHYLTTI